MKGRIRILAMLAIVALPLALSVGLVAAQSAPTRTEVEALGKAIFFDKNLSLNHNQSCASCHAPEAGWVGGVSAINAGGAVYEGSIPGAFGDRKPPSAAYATQAPILHMPEEGFFVGGNFWDGRATGETLGSPAAEQALGPFLNPKEQALPDSACVVYRVEMATYPVTYAAVYGPTGITWPADIETTCALETGHVSLSLEDRAKSDMAYDQIGMAIAAYEGSTEVNAFTSKFDAKKAGLVKFTKEENKGWSLFRGKGKCDLCHLASGPQPLFTDYTYDNLGLPQNPMNPAGVAPAFVDKGLGAFLETRLDYADYAEENYGKFKVPTLRNVALASAGTVKAYGHNGYFKSLEGIVHFYNTRDTLPTCPVLYTETQALAADCWPAPEYDENVNDDELGNLRLSAEEEANIVAFMKTLSDGYVIPAP